MVAAPGATGVSSNRSQTLSFTRPLHGRGYGTSGPSTPREDPGLYKRGLQTEVVGSTWDVLSISDSSSDSGTERRVTDQPPRARATSHGPTPRARTTRHGATPPRTTHGPAPPRTVTRHGLTPLAVTHHLPPETPRAGSKVVTTGDGRPMCL